MNSISPLIFGLLLAMTATGCATNPHTMDTNATHSIEFLSFDGCPNTPPMRESLEAALAQTSASFTAVDLTKLPDDDRRRSFGSPTILIDGSDLFGLAPADSTTLTCRVYPSGLPNADTLIAKLSEITP